MFPRPDDETLLAYGRLIFNATVLEDRASNFASRLQAKPRGQKPVSVYLTSAIHNLGNLPLPSSRTAIMSWLMEVKRQLETRNSILHGMYANWSQTENDQGEMVDQGPTFFHMPSRGKPIYIPATASHLNSLADDMAASVDNFIPMFDAFASDLNGQPLIP